MSNLSGKGSVSLHVAPPPHAADARVVIRALRLDAAAFAVLFRRLGPSQGLWRAAEVAALREQGFERPVVYLGSGDGVVASLVYPEAARVTRLGLEGLPAGSLGTIMSDSVLEHVSNVGGLLAEGARCLRPGGRLIFTAPTEAFPAWLALSSVSRRYADWRKRRLGHLNLWPVERWQRQLEGAGLAVEIVRPYLRKPYVTAWDIADVAEGARVGRTGLVNGVWRSLPASFIERLAARAARLDLSARPPGGGRLIVACKL